jgi:hypothetical protein
MYQAVSRGGALNRLLASTLKIYYLRFAKVWSSSTLHRKKIERGFKA